MATLGRMIEAMRRHGGDELVHAVMSDVSQSQSRGPSTILPGALPEARREFHGDASAERLEEHPELPSNRRRRAPPDHDQDEDEP